MGLSLLNRYIDRFSGNRQQQLLKEAEQKRQYQKALAQSLEHWLNSDIGTYFNQRIETDKGKALEELAKVSPEDIEKIRSLQAKIAVINTVNQYMAEVLLSASVIK